MALRIAVTGHSGFVGCWLLRKLTEKASDQEVFPFFSDSAADISDAATVEAQLQHLSPDVIVHLASIASPSEASADRRRCFEVNVGGTFNLANAIVKYTPETWLLFVGSSEAYGASFNDNDEPLTESAALNPLSIYGASKAAADVLVGQMANEGLKVVRFRPFNHTGPEQTPMYVVPAVAQQIARIERGLQEPTLRVGNLEAERDFLDVRDVVAAYALAISRRHSIRSGTVINVSSGRPTSIQSIIDRLVRMSDLPMEIIQDPARYSSNAILRASGNSSAARSLLSWLPKWDLDETLRDTLNYWRARVTKDGA